MSEKSKRRTRILSVVAATIISLSCGTNYAYSAWAPQFAAHMRLSSTQSNLMGVCGNIGMYASGIPVGMLVDAKGAKPGVLFGSLMLGVGYYSMHRAYEAGAGSVSLPWLCFFMFITGSGGCAAFSGSIKTSVLNWPTHRGTATAFPLSAFGLSAFFFSILSIFAFPDNTSNFLVLLSVGTFCMIFFSSFILRVVPDTHGYKAAPSREAFVRSDSNQLHQKNSGSSKHDSDDALAEQDETSSLMSKSSKSVPGDLEENSGRDDNLAHDPHHINIRGVALFSKVEFWQLWLMLGLLTGVGLMTINNIGNDAQALWSHYDSSVTPGWIQRRQLMHVSNLSIFSFFGRLLSGIGSDLIVKKLHMNRFWCLFISSSIFCGAQICGARIENPNYLIFVSGLTGLAYGFLFGVYPALVAETFGVLGMSQNWGYMTMAPVISGNVFNLVYGMIYDHHSTIGPDGHRNCTLGLKCYSTAYWIALVGSLTGVFLSLWSIRYQHVKKNKARVAELARAA